MKMEQISPSDSKRQHFEASGELGVGAKKERPRIQGKELTPEDEQEITAGIESLEVAVTADAANWSGIADKLIREKGLDKPEDDAEAMQAEAYADAYSKMQGAFRRAMLADTPWKKALSLMSELGKLERTEENPTLKKHYAMRKDDIGTMIEKHIREI